MDELERAIYNAFTTSANSLSHLYALMQVQHRQAFQAGERQGLDNLLRWILERGSHTTVEDIISYIQNEIYYEGMVPLAPVPQDQRPPNIGPTSIPEPSMTPCNLPLASAPNSVEGGSQQFNMAIYHGESSRGSQSRGNEMTTESYIPLPYTPRRWNQDSNPNGDGPSRRSYQ